MGKDEVVPALSQAQCHEDQLRNGGIAPRILNLGSRCMRVVNFTLRTLNIRGEGPRYPSDRRLDGPQNRSGRGRGEKNSIIAPADY